MVAHTKCFSELTTPSAPFKGSFAAFYSWRVHPSCSSYAGPISFLLDTGGAFL